MSIRRDIAANYIGAGIAALAPILAIPWYIAILGTESWGLISFIAVLQGLLALINVGLGQTLVREFSRLSIAPIDGYRKIATLLYGVERIYWLVGAVVAVLLISGADAVVTYWLKLKEIPDELAKMVIYGAAGIFAVQFPVSIYRSVLTGCNGQVTQNILQALAAITRHAGSVMVLWVSKSIPAYLLWNVLIALAETLVTAKVSWGILGVKRNELSWSPRELKRLFAFSLGWSLAVMLAILTMQIDKLAVSWMLPIEQLGFYTIASSLAMGLLQVYSPIASAVLPRVVQLQGEPERQWQLNLKLAGIMLALAGVVAIGFFMFGEMALTIWLRDKNVVNAVFPVLGLLLVGTTMNAIYNIGYMNWLAAGATRRILIVNAFSLSSAILMTPFCIEKQGLMGASVAWLLINSIGMVLSLDWLAKGRRPND